MAPEPGRFDGACGLAPITFREKLWCSSFPSSVLYPYQIRGCLVKFSIFTFQTLACSGLLYGSFTKMNPRDSMHFFLRNGSQYRRWSRAIIGLHPSRSLSIQPKVCDEYPSHHQTSFQWWDGGDKRHAHDCFHMKERVCEGREVLLLVLRCHGFLQIEDGVLLPFFSVGHDVVAHFNLEQ